MFLGLPKMYMYMYLGTPKMSICVSRTPKVFPSTPNFRGSSTDDSLQNNFNLNYFHKSSGRTIFKLMADVADVDPNDVFLHYHF